MTARSHRLRAHPVLQFHHHKTRSTYALPSKLVPPSTLSINCSHSQLGTSISKLSHIPSHHHKSSIDFRLPLYNPSTQTKQALWFSPVNTYRDSPFFRLRSADPYELQEPCCFPAIGPGIAQRNSHLSMNHLRER